MRLGAVHCGTGSWTTSPIPNLCAISSGMRKRYINTTVRAVRGSSRNHGLETAFGKSRLGYLTNVDLYRTYHFLKSSLPQGAKMVCLELYADKSKLSSFGTQKGYPVMARIVNLPVKIRNGKGVGGARVVGWLPVVRLTTSRLAC